MKIFNSMHFAKIFFISLCLIFSSDAFALEKEKSTYLQSTQDPLESLLPMLGGLIVILAFIFFLAFLFRRFGNISNGTKLISIVESYALGSKEKLAIVKVENECFLIGITANSINSIGKLDSLKIKEAIDSNSSNLQGSSGFAPLMAKFMSGKMTADINNKKDN
ncbi:MAG: flagellar biosynthetic protein FliO [Kangiella sp.]|nr:MAG: flagellar biosynthetic protein FliO [Kangiella sp.]